MLSNVSQYSPQGLQPQFSQPGPYGYGGGMPFGQEFATGMPGQYPSANGLQQQNPFAAQWQNPFAQSPFAGHLGSHNPVQHLVPVLAQLAQHIAAQNALTQQIGSALVQIAQQLTQQLQYPQHQHQQGYAGLAPFTGAGQSIGGQPFGMGTPFGGAFGPQYGLTPQAQGWGANRAQTIQ